MFRLQPKIVGQSLASHVDECWDTFSLQIIETKSTVSFRPSSGRGFMPHCRITIVGWHGAQAHKSRASLSS